MTCYYNECDPGKAEWLREIIKASLAAPGDVDERSIADVRAADLVGYAQCHFFAGIGCWSYALRLAGWPDDRPVWTGSCPCPSFSAAGKGRGFDDPRHLWPEWFRLIRECRPGVVFGEQVAAAIGHGWLDLVCGDVEAEGYAAAAAVLGAHSVGAPHIRQRIYFVADTTERRREPVKVSQPGRCGTGMGAAQQIAKPRHVVPSAGATRGFWADCDWWYGRDGKHRPIEPGLQPLAHGPSARVLRLRSYGDAIVVQAAQAFVESYIEAHGGHP